MVLILWLDEHVANFASVENQEKNDTISLLSYKWVYYPKKSIIQAYTLIYLQLFES